MSEVVPDHLPPGCGRPPQSDSPARIDLGRHELSSSLCRKLYSFSDALQCLAFNCPQGAIVVVEGVPDETRSSTLRAFASTVVLGKRQWAVKNALRDVIIHSGDPFPPSERFIIDGYIPKRGGISMEVVFQAYVAKKCAGSPAYVLTEKWPDPITLGHGPQDPFTRFAWANGFFTRGSEVVFVQYRDAEQTFEVGRATLISKNGSLHYCAIQAPVGESRAGEASEREG